MLKYTKSLSSHKAPDWGSRGFVIKRGYVILTQPHPTKYYSVTVTTQTQAAFGLDTEVAVIVVVPGFNNFKSANSVFVRGVTTTTLSSLEVHVRLGSVASYGKTVALNTGVKVIPIE